MDYQKVVINDGWKFTLNDEKQAFTRDYKDDNWQIVTLPHDWSIRLPLSREYSSGTGYVRGGTAWYRKHFNLPESYRGKKIFVVFDGVYKNSQVWVNGYYLGKRPYGYSTFQYDISDFLSFGEENANVISVKVSHEDVADSRWYTGSGITRKVSLLVYDKVFPAEYGIFFRSENVSDKQAEIVVVNELSSKVDLTNVVIGNRIIDAAGKIVLSMEQSTDLTSKEFKLIENQGMINTPNLWSPKNPYLYTLETFVIDPNSGESSVIDRQRVGIRSFFFDPERGFFLNEEQTIMKGVCVHHDGGCLGAAMTKEVWRRRLKKLKKMGCNAIRMSHNPHMPELYELCDEMGFLVMDEAFDEWEAPKNKWHIGHNVYPPKHDGYAEDFPEWHERDLTAMVRRDRNHPSVIIWSIGNEIDYPNDPYNHPLFETATGNNDQNKPVWYLRYNPNRPNAERLPVIAARLAKIVKKSDPTRPVTAALAFPELSTQIGFLDHLDVVGYNYKEHLYDEDHQRFPDKVFLGSENKHDYEAWKAVRDREFISAQFLWTGIDYLGECVGWPYHGSPAGLLTTAGFEKSAYYLRQSWWSDEPVVHLVTARYDGKQRPWKEVHASWNYVAGEEIEVRCYTNQFDVELYLNGKLCEDRLDTTDYGYIAWLVKFEPGILEAVSKQGTNKLETVTAPVKIELVSECERTDDILQIELSVLDERDRLVVSDRSRITVFVEGGELLGLDNGDLADVTDYAANYRTTFDGRLMIYARRTGEAKVRVTATSPHLRSAVIEV
ncbi:MAG: glycoside hydrolase family 2 protein [Firmicutes bacterium]|nr:glycoside hydrolase family 2 protein [Bacillota bacterium]